MDVAYVGASEAREDFAGLVNRAAYGRERVIVERRGKALAAVISIEDLRLLERLIEEEEDRLDLGESHRILAEDQGGAHTMEGSEGVPEPLIPVGFPV